MKRSILGAAALALVVTASSVQAQKPISFGVALGASMPTGDFGDAVEMGYHALGTLAWAPPSLPVGIRFDAQYNMFSGKDFSGISGPDLKVLGITANATWGMPMAASPVSPYLIGGLGMYHSSVSDCPDGADCSSDKMGFNVGVGTKFALSGFGTFAEIRYHSVAGEKDANGDSKRSNFIPISFGIMF
jgi:hypothetical protein